MTCQVAVRQAGVIDAGGEEGGRVKADGATRRNMGLRWRLLMPLGRAARAEMRAFWSVGVSKFEEGISRDAIAAP